MAEEDILSVVILKDAFLPKDIMNTMLHKLHIFYKLKKRTGLVMLLINTAIGDQKSVV